MYSFFHFVWLAICALLIAAAFVYLRRKRPPLKSVLSLACAGCVLSEVTKILSVIELVPSADGSAYYPYLELQHLPFHLCSMQILFIFYARFARNGPVKETLLAFMYPSCLIGALLAILIPTTFSGTVDAREAFARPLTYQYFLYHTMLIIFGAYIPMSREIELRPRHYLSTFAVPVYSSGTLLSVEYTTNFLFTAAPPIDSIKLTELWHWFAYIGVLGVLAFGLVALLYIPVFRRAGRK